MKNVFVQLGINSKLEYACLAYPDFKERAAATSDTNRYVPEELLAVERPYTVIGVDMNRLANEHVRQKYKDIPNIHIWDYCLWHENIENFEHGNYVAVDQYLPEGVSHDRKAQGTAITMMTLIEKIKQLPGHQDAVIQGLHVNIEGSEYNLLIGIDWLCFHPRWIRIGVNHYKAVHKSINQKSPIYVKDTLLANGYTHIPDPRDTDEFLTFHLKRGFDEDSTTLLPKPKETPRTAVYLAG